MQTNPLVSVIVPIYNQERCLGQCLDSLAAQTLRDIEFVCVDDGSTDASADILAEYARADARFRVVSKANSGYGDSMNRGLDEARGLWIGIVEPDDYVDVRMFETLAEAARSEACDIVKGAYTRVIHSTADQSPEFVDCFYLHAIHPPQQPFTIDLCPRILEYHPSIWSALYRASFLRDANIRFKPVAGSGWTDNPFFLETMVAAKGIVYVDEPLYFYREFEDGSMSHLGQWQTITDRWKDMEDVLRRYKVTDKSVLEAHYVRGCAYIQMIARDFLPKDPHAAHGIKSIAQTMDYDIIYDSRRIPQIDKDTYQQFVPKSTRIKHRIKRALDKPAATIARPLVSVIVPIYNQERYLGQCLDSLAAQTLRDIEFVCVDDGSTDASAAILANYAQTDARFRVVSKANSGYGDSMNRGLDEARGLWIGIVEPDDFADARMFEEYVKAAQKLHVDVVKSNYWEHAESGDAPIEVYEGFPYGCAFNVCDRLDVLRVRPAIWSGLYRARMIEEEGIRLTASPGASFQDTSFMAQCFIAAHGVALLDSSFLHYRIDNESSSVKSDAKVFAVCDEFNRTLEFLRARGTADLTTFGPMINAVRFQTYAWNYNRIADASRPEFVNRWSAEIGQAQSEGLFDSSLLSDPMQRVLPELQKTTAQFLTAFPEEIEL